jgi:hypothetical protein
VFVVFFVRVLSGFRVLSEAAPMSSRKISTDLEGSVAVETLEFT